MTVAGDWVRTGLFQFGLAANAGWRGAAVGCLLSRAGRQGATRQAQTLLLSSAPSTPQWRQVAAGGGGESTRH